MTPSASATAPLELGMPLSDGIELFYRAWMASTHRKRAIILCHRGHEHSGRLDEVARAVAPPDTHVFAWDARGHGRSPGKRGFAPSFTRMVQDLDDFVRGISNRHEIDRENIVVVAHSVGAVVASVWVHDHAPPIRGLVLVTPALRVKLYIPGAIPMLRLLHRIKPEAVISSYVKAKMLTHDQGQVAAYQADPLITRDISNRILLQMHDAATRVIADAGVIEVPTLVLSAGSDWVVSLAAQRRLVERLGATHKQHIIYPGMHHAILHERDRHLPFAAIRDFALARFSDPVLSRQSLVEQGSPATRAAHTILQRHLSIFSPKRWAFAVTRGAMNTLGRVSTGIATGWKTGFDSGESLDHVYRNQPSGFTPVGRWFDKAFLSSVGWQGIRQRRVHIIERISGCLRNVLELQGRAHLVDIAAGPGRYDLDALEKVGDARVTALLRDRSPTGVAAGQALVAERKLSQVLNAVGDAFDGENLAALNPRPDVAVVSGLYELFPDNALIRRSLAGLAQAVPSGGWLIYTNQPWHPQLEFISRCLINRDGEPWLMRCRSQAEMDALVAAAGFEKVAMDIDEWGIFTVSVARRR